MFLIVTIAQTLQNLDQDLALLLCYIITITVVCNAFHLCMLAVLQPHPPPISLDCRFFLTLSDSQSPATTNACIPCCTCMALEGATDHIRVVAALTNHLMYPDFEVQRKKDYCMQSVCAQREGCATENGACGCAGEPICTLALPPHSLHADINGDGVLEHILAIGDSAHAHKGHHMHDLMMPCNAYVFSGYPARTPLFNGTVCSSNSRSAMTALLQAQHKGKGGREGNFEGGNWGQGAPLKMSLTS
jgi:hypothetical protein